MLHWSSSWCYLCWSCAGVGLSSCGSCGSRWNTACKSVTLTATLVALVLLSIITSQHTSLSVTDLLLPLEENQSRKVSLNWMENTRTTISLTLKRSTETRNVAWMHEAAWFENWRNPPKKDVFYYFYKRTHQHQQRNQNSIPEKAARWDGAK